MAKHILSIVLVLTLLNNCALHVTTTTNSTEHLNSCILRLIKNLLPNDATIYFIFDNPNQMFNAVKVDHPRVVLDVNKPLKMTLRNYNAYIIYTEGYISLKATLTKLRDSKVWDKSESPRKKFLVITSSFQKEIFKILSSFDIINVIVVVDGSDPNLYTFDPFAEGNKCGRTPNLYFINKCYGNLTTFNDTIKRLDGCALTLLGNNLTKNFKKVPCLGILGYLFELMSKILNTTATNSIKENEKEAHYDHNEGILFSHTLTRGVDWLNDYDLSDIFYRDKLVWVVPKGDKFPAIKIMALIYDRYVWMSIAIAFIVVICISWLIAKNSEEEEGFKNFWRGFLSTFALTLCSVDNLRPKTNALKFIALFYSIYCIQISTSFQANLMSILTQSIYGRTITTVEELANSRLTAVLSGNAIKLNFNATYNDEIAAKLRKKVLHVPVVNLHDTLMELVKYRNTSALVSKDSIKVCLQGGESVVDVLDSKFLTMEMTLAMRKGHFFKPTLNKLLTAINENGFYGRIFKMAMSQSEFVGETSNIALGMDHLGGNFLCWAIGLFFATAAFAVEIILFYCKKEIPQYGYFNF